MEAALGVEAVPTAAPSTGAVAHLGLATRQVVDRQRVLIVATQAQHHRLVTLGAELQLADITGSQLRLLPSRQRPDQHLAVADQGHAAAVRGPDHRPPRLRARQLVCRRLGSWLCLRPGSLQAAEVQHLHQRICARGLRQDQQAPLVGAGLQRPHRPRHGAGRQQAAAGHFPQPQLAVLAGRGQLLACGPGKRLEAAGVLQHMVQLRQQAGVFE